MAVLFLMGPTAIGKTAFGVRLAERLDAEIISVDSALVYRGLDIGTAKPSPEERRGIPHHLIDIREPSEVYSAADFCRDARAEIQAIHSRGRHALLVGGTFLYFRALAEGLAELPSADAHLRAALADEIDTRGLACLHEELSRVDPTAAARIHPNDPQRLQRALEVYRSTGRTLSELQKDTKPYLDREPFRVALAPRERSWLHARIRKRFESMLEAGLIDEIKDLLRDPRNTPELPAFRSVGYRQVIDFLHGDESAQRGGDWVERAVVATRQLAKRQLTWLRSMPDTLTMPVDELSDLDAMLEELGMAFDRWHADTVDRSSDPGVAAVRAETLRSSGT